MRSTRKVMLMLAAIAVLVSVTVFATVAYFTDEATVTNTFTVGKVSITLDEAVVNTSGTPVTPAERTESGNKYHLLPGKTYTKDPTLTVKGSSDSAYVRMMVTISCANELNAICTRHGMSFSPELLLNDFGNGWYLYKSYTDTASNSLVYEYRYVSPVTTGGTDSRLPALFKSFTIPGAFDGSDLASIASMQIIVEGHAIQLAGFEMNEELAWQNFDSQLGSSSLPTVSPTPRSTISPEEEPEVEASEPSEVEPSEVEPSGSSQEEAPE